MWLFIDTVCTFVDSKTRLNEVFGEVIRQNGDRTRMQKFRNIVRIQYITLHELHMAMIVNYDSFYRKWPLSS